MHPRERLFLEVANRLARKANRAAAFWGVRAAYLGGTTPYSALSAQDQAILRTKGNPAIRMNDLFLVRPSELPTIRKRYPELARFCREIDYPQDMWWSDPSVATEARPSSLRENWSSARSLALMGEQDEEDDEVDEISARNQREREEIIALIENQRARGEDLWTETEYPVLESQASFSARGSNDDLDDLFNEEPKDPRSEAIAFDKIRQWAPDRYESFFNENGLNAVAPSGDFFSDEDERFGEHHRFCVPLVTDEITNKPIRGGFVTRAMFFEERDRLLENMDSDYETLPVSRRFRHAKQDEILTKGFRRDYRGWNEKAAAGPLILPSKVCPANPAAPERPALKRGQRHVVIAHRSDGSVYECAPSY